MNEMLLYTRFFGNPVEVFGKSFSVMGSVRVSVLTSVTLPILFVPQSRCSQEKGSTVSSVNPPFHVEYRSGNEYRSGKTPFLFSPSICVTRPIYNIADEFPDQRHSRLSLDRLKPKDPR